MKQSIYIRDTDVSATDILGLLAKGYGYDHILKTYPVVTLADIAASVAIAKDLLENWVTPDGQIEIDAALKITANGRRLIDISKARQAAPRAYEKWETAEDNRLASQFKEGKPVADIAKALQRQEGATYIRLKNLGLIR